MADADPMLELQAMSSKRSNLRDKLKKRREAIGSILSQATPSVSSSPSAPSSATADPVISPSTEVKKEQPKNEPDPASSFERNKKRSISAVDPKSSSQLGNKKAKVDSDDLMSLLSAQSAKEKADQKQRDEILELLGKPTAKEQENFEMFRNNSGKQLKQFCKHSTKYECTRATGSKRPCDNLHFVKIIQPHTDESLGDCSFLNTCFHMDTCKYIHYEVDQDDVRRAEKRKRSVHHPDSSGSANGQQKLNSTKSFGGNNSINGMSKSTDGTSQRSSIGSGIKLVPPQWVQCDLRNLDLPVLGKFSVVMADPPWDIHMELPYGTMSDDEMRKLPVPTLQDEGLIFLWVTGRAMELGRECLKLWGYERVDEIIWVKTNQLQRIIRTGRTGHWINHGKEHCLVGLKGKDMKLNRGLDCDVIVAEVRATSHKPDEIYGIIERLSPGTRKVELFGRPHNVNPNWVTLGNQLDGIVIHDEEMVKRWNDVYPDGYNITKDIFIHARHKP